MKYRGPDHIVAREKAKSILNSLLAAGGLVLKYRTEHVLCRFLKENEETFENLLLS